MLQDYQKEEIRALVDEFASDNGRGYFSDRLSEIVDGYLPIYNTELVDEWRAMPSDYDNTGADLFGAPDEPNIYTLMTLDLMNYYGAIVAEYANEYAESIGVEFSDL